jgi:hypothetical protein
MQGLMRLARGSGLPAALLLVGIGVMAAGGAAAQGSADTRQACTPDAMRICSDVIPDVPKITKCMMAHYRQLSPECRLAMANEHRALRYRSYRHHYHHEQ